MSHIAKRPRLQGPTNPALSLSSTSSLLETSRQASSATPKLRNLQLEHENSLRQSALRLKSNWEDICKRYGRDFDGEGDEVDLETGEVVVDNGHLRNLVENQDDTWDADAYDDDAASTASSLDILGMRPSLGRDQLRVPMSRDNEAEEIDVDEVEVDRDAIDDLFDELDELTMTKSRGKLEERKRREGQMDSTEPVFSPFIVQAEASGHDKLPSPASSDILTPAEEELRVQSVMKELVKDDLDVPLEELPSENLVMEKFREFGPAVWAFFQTLKENGPSEAQEPGFGSQLTPVSECGTSLADKLVDEAEKQESRPDFAVKLLEVVVEPMVEPVVESVENVGPSSLSGHENEPLVEIPDSLEHIPDRNHEDAVVMSEIVCAAPEQTVSEEATIPEYENGPDPATKALIREDAISLNLKDISESDTLIATESDNLEATEIEKDEKQTSEEKVQTVAHTADTIDEDLSTIDYLYGDIDDLTTILQPKLSTPVTPKNRPPIKKLKSKKKDNKDPTLRKTISKRKFSEMSSPGAPQPTSPTKGKQKGVTAKNKSPAHATPRKDQPKSVSSTRSQNFWSALPDDPFFDPLWQDAHPDGEPSHAEFERRRRILEEHSSSKQEQQVSFDDDDLVLVTPTTSKNKKTPRGKVKPSSSQKPEAIDKTFENRLHTPRSGKFLEILQKRLFAGIDKVKTEEEQALQDDESNTSTAKADMESDTANLETPMPKIKNEYGLSDDEDELSREVFFVKDNDLEILGTKKQRRKRGRPAKETPKEKAIDHSPMPLIVSERRVVSSPTKTTTNGIKREEDDPTLNPFAKCGDSGYRCEKTICFKCVEDWDT